MYQKEIIKHYIKNWQNEPQLRLWDRGSFEKLPADFRVLEFKPNDKRDMWTYATCCMSQPNDGNPIELHIFSSKQDVQIVELLTMVAYYHRNTSNVGLNHTVNFGKPWQENSLCTYGFISLPYLDGPELENFNFKRNHIVKFYWLIPIMKQEVDFKIKHGVEALEEKFDNGFNYIDPLRNSVIF